MQGASSLEKTMMLEETEGKRRWHWRMRWLDGIIDSKGMTLSKLRDTVAATGAWCSTRGCKVGHG